MIRLAETHIVMRLKKRLAQLNAGQEVATRDLKSLLTAEQFEAMKNALSIQKDMRQSTPQISKNALKSKRQIRIEAVSKALAEATCNLPDSFRQLQQKTMTHQKQIYFEAVKEALAEGQNEDQAKILASKVLERISSVLEGSARRVEEPLN